MRVIKIFTYRYKGADEYECWVVPVLNIRYAKPRGYNSFTKPTLLILVGWLFLAFDFKFQFK